MKNGKDFVPDFNKNKDIVSEVESKETIDEFEERLKMLRDSVANKAEKIVGNGMLWFHEQFYPFSCKILEKFDDPKIYMAWHVLSGSSVLGKDRESLENDFPEPYNLESFCEELLISLDEIDEFKHKKGTFLTSKNKEDDGKNFK